MGPTEATAAEPGSLISRAYTKLRFLSLTTKYLEYQHASSQTIGKQRYFQAKSFPILIPYFNKAMKHCRKYRVTLNQCVFFQGGGKKKYQEDEDFEETENSDDTESDFEDPDTVAVPQTLAASEKKAAASGAAAEEASDDDIEVISSTNNGTKFGFGKPGKGINNLCIHMQKKSG